MPAETEQPAGPPTPPVQSAAPDDTRSLESGLDALETRETIGNPWTRRVLSAVVPPLVALALIILVWQVVFWLDVKPDYVLPSPAMVWETFVDQLGKGNVQEAVWVSLKRGLLGFALSIVVAVPLGLVVARSAFVRTAIGPILTGLQTLPSVAWVPAAIIFFGLTETAIYAVILLGAVPSIANGLVAGVRQTPPIYNRVGHVLGARRWAMIRHVLLPAAFPGFLAGLKQGWAFSWRSLMAAELIVRSAALGVGLGQVLDEGRQLFDMSLVFVAIFSILAVGILVELLLFSPLERRMLRSRGLAGAK